MNYWGAITLIFIHAKWTANLDLSWWLLIVFVSAAVCEAVINEAVKEGS